METGSLKSGPLKVLKQKADTKRRSEEIQRWGCCTRIILCYFRSVEHKEVYSCEKK